MTPDPSRTADIADIAVMATTEATPFTLPVRPNAIPAELRARRQWVAWRWERRAEKWTKVPVNARTGKRAASNNPTTWTDFETAQHYAANHTEIAGVGYMFSQDDPYSGIDFDTCRGLETGALDTWAEATLAGFDSYAEVSPSGTGIKAFVKATLPDHGIRSKRPDDLPGGTVEMYDRGRFFTVTGHHVRNTPATIHDAQEAVTALYARLTSAKPRDDAAPSSAARKTDDKQATRDTLTDDELITAAREARNGAKFTDLWMGNIADYASHSEADLALCSLLAFYTGPDAARIDRLFRESRLMRSKWDEKRGTETYGEMTVAKALSGLTAYWQPGERYADNRERQAIQSGDTTASEPDAAPRDEWTPKITYLSDVQPERVRHLWPGRIPLGKLTVVDGDPGLGKTTVLLDIGARLTTDAAMPDGTASDLDGPAGVVILTAEDGLADTIRPRLDAAGADVSKVVALECLVNGDEERSLSLTDLNAIEAAVQAVDAKLVIIDPLMAFLSSETNSYRDQDMRRVLAPLARLAERLECAIVVIRHLSKGGGANAVYRGGGSIGIIGAARCGLLVAADPDDETGAAAFSRSRRATSPPCLPPSPTPSNLPRTAPRTSRGKVPPPTPRSNCSPCRRMMRSGARATKRRTFFGNRWRWGRVRRRR